ncbi:MAG: helix-turn-helix domain-containing protein, partial [Kiritimatiellae bacterium]|nr:helix-turn-helix domain-containing protein [Kiritimatiellia bacterium]
LRRADLDRTFRSELARSVGEEIRRQRLARAKLLLETTDLDLHTIATQTGYCGAPHLANVFKKGTGTSPAKWRCRKTERS